ncbi:hypothetical protein D018_1720, partial [Vibrio parahaemolyticus VP2007-007]|jgi:transcription elongation factor
MKGI